MPRESLSILQMKGVDCIHKHARAISRTLSQQLALPSTTWTSSSENYKSTFSIDSAYDVASTSTTLLSSPLLERIYRMPRSEQGGLQVMILATGSQLTQFADKLNAQDAKVGEQFSPQLLQASQLGYDLGESVAAFDVRGFMVGRATSVVLFSIKKLFLEFTPQDHAVLFDFVNRYLSGNGPIHGFDSPMVKALCLATHIFQNFATITAVQTADAIATEISKIIKKQEQDGVLLTDVDYGQALKLANTFAVQEIIYNSGATITDTLSKCQGDYGNDEITRVVTLFEKLTTASKQLDFAGVFQVIKEIDAFLTETKKPDSFWSRIYVSWDSLFRQSLTDLQQAIATYMLNVNMRPTKARKRSLSQMAELPFPKRVDSGIAHGVFETPSAVAADSTATPMDVVQAPVPVPVESKIPGSPQQ